MEYNKIIEGTFLKRPNRFIANVLVDGKEETVHVKNTGRCRKLLLSGAQVPNAVVFQALNERKIKEIKDLTYLKREVTFGKSRYDIYFEDENHKGFMEVKGVTLEDERICMFPDAPTERGTKHVLEMIDAVKEGYKGIIFFLIQMKGPKMFRLNWNMDRAFAEAIKLVV